jgi:hypothetical protein
MTKVTSGGMVFETNVGKVEVMNQAPFVEANMELAV